MPTEIEILYPPLENPQPDFSFLDSGGPQGEVPKLALPFRMERHGNRSAAATVPQDSLTEIAQCAYAVLATPVGSREEEPEFGVEDQALRKGGADLDELAKAVEEWEPRAEVLTEAQLDGVVQEVRVTIDAVQ